MTTVDVKTAVQQAVLFIHEVIQDGRAKDTMLEEIELSDDEKEWLITVSVPRPASLASIMGEPGARDYKTLRINTVTGEVKSLKIRTL